MVTSSTLPCSASVMNWEKVTSFLAMAGDWRRLQRRMMRIPAEIQKRRFFIGLVLGLGIILRPFKEAFYHVFRRNNMGNVLFLHVPALFLAHGCFTPPPVARVDAGRAGMI